MTTQLEILDTVIAHVNEQVDAAPAVVQTWQRFQEVYAILRNAGAGSLLLLDLEAAVNACASECIRAAFLAGLAFDAKALLLAAAQEQEAAHV